MLCGPPGCGKTTFVRSLAKELELAIIVPSNLLGSHVGDSERNTANFFKSAEANAPCIIWMDEAESTLAQRGTQMSTDSGVNDRVQSIQLAYSGDPDRKAIWIAATNFIERIDRAYLRPGRLGDLIIVIAYPDLNARPLIFDIHLRGIPVDKTVTCKEGRDELAKDSFMMSGADIQNWCKEAAAYAYEQNTTDSKGNPTVTIDDFRFVRKYKEINTEARLADLMNQYQHLKQLQSGIDLRILEQTMQEFAQGEQQEADKMKPFMESFSKLHDNIVV